MPLIRTGNRISGTAQITCPVCQHLQSTDLLVLPSPPVEMKDMNLEDAVVVVGDGEIAVEIVYCCRQCKIPARHVCVVQ